MTTPVTKLLLVNFNNFYCLRLHIALKIVVNKCGYVQETELKQAFHFKRFCLYSGIFCGGCKDQMQLCVLNSNLRLSEVVSVRPELGDFAMGPENFVLSITEQRL